MNIVVLLKDGADRAGFLDDLAANGLPFEVLSALPNLVIVRDTDAATFPLKSHPAVELIEDDQPDAFKPVETVTIDPEPDMGPWPILRHTSRDRPWGDVIKLPWTGEFSCSRTGVGVDVYLVDSGLLATHQEFGERAEAIDGWVPLTPHGTSCASCAAGETLGLARDALVFVAAGLRNENGTGSLSDILSAVNACLSHYNDRAATDRPALLSLSFSGTSNLYVTALESCIDAGMVVLAAAGNGRSHLADIDVYPAENAGVIAVGGINMDDGPYNTGTSGTNYGTEVDILGGSQRVRVAGITSDSAYRVGSGTSYGTPHVAGVVACILQDYKRLTSSEQVRAVGTYLYEQATFGRYRQDPRFVPMTPAIAYLDPGEDYPPVPGLTPKV